MLLSVVFRCQMGSEELLKSEFIALGIAEDRLKLRQGSILVIDQIESIYLLIIHSRLASRALLLLSKGYVENDYDLYNLAYSIPWIKHIHYRAELKINFKGTNRQLINSHYSTQKLKDAIVDYYQRNDQPRPIINLEQPDAIIDARLHNNKCEISLDLTGPLHKRFRVHNSLAPIRETLASLLLARTGWKADTPIVDPFCGSGVFLIEATMIALKKAPGCYREHKLINAWLNHQPELFNQLLQQAKAQELNNKEGFKAYGSDIDPQAIVVAKYNAAQAGVSQYIEWHVADAVNLSNYSNKNQGLIISNPPYGERLENVGSLIPVYQQFANQVKKHFANWQLAIISSQDMLFTSLRLRASKMWKVKNGNLDCQFKLFNITNHHLIKDKNFIELPNSLENQRLELRAQEVFNRLNKNYKKIQKYLIQEKITCYRIYDADIPNYNFAVDVYQPALEQVKQHNKNNNKLPLTVVVQEYAAPANFDPNKSNLRLLDGIQAVQAYFSTAKLIVKKRQRQRGTAQYHKLANRDNYFLINEDQSLFYVNLEDYVDTGIFLDHREVRKYIKRNAKGKDFLNLFSYTSTATVHAIEGGANSSISIDLSKSYVNWSELNFLINKINLNNHQVLRDDVLAWIETQTIHGKPIQTFDLIFFDPPTFSNSKAMDSTWEVSRDYLLILKKLYLLLRHNGELIFSNNRRDFKLDQSLVEDIGFTVRNITNETMPLDFRDKKIHQVWSLCKN